MTAVQYFSFLFNGDNFTCVLMSNRNDFEFCRNASLSVVDLFCLGHNFTTDKEISCTVSSVRNDELVGRVRTSSERISFVLEVEFCQVSGLEIRD
jgi:hypothetical protein